MENPAKRRKIERSLGGPIEGLKLNGRERSVSLGGSSKKEEPIMPKLVLPPHGAPGHPAHGDQVIDGSSQGVDRPHYPLESADTRPTRVHARQIVQRSVTDAAPTAPKTSEPISPSQSSPTPKADDNPHPGQVVPPAAVAAANARNQALTSQQAQAQAQDVPVKQLDGKPTALAPASTPVSASPEAMQVPGSLSQQIVKVPSTPPPFNPSATPDSSASYFSASPASSPSPSPQHTSTLSAPSPTLTPKKSDFVSIHNGTTSGELLLNLPYFSCTDWRFSFYDNLFDPEQFILRVKYDVCFSLCATDDITIFDGQPLRNDGFHF